MSDLDQRLGSALGRLAGARTPEQIDDVLGPVRTRVRRRHHARLGAIVAAPVLAIAAVAWTTWPDASEDTPVVTDPVSTTTIDDGQAEANRAAFDQGIEVLDPGPLSPRYGAAVVDLDDGRVLVWGGETDVNFGFESNTTFADGAVYDTSTSEWTSISDSPITSHADRGAVAEFTGTEVIALGGRSTASWNPLDGRWRERPPAPGDMVQAVWTGDALIAWESWTIANVDPIWASFDPVSDVWSEIEPPPVSVERETAVWSGEELIVVGHPAGARGYLPAEGAAYNPRTRTWRPLPTAPVDSQALGSAWLSNRMLTVNYDMGAAEYDPRSDTWRELPQVPGAFSENGVVMVASDERAIVLAGGVWLHTRDRRWVPIPPSPMPAMATLESASNGDVLVFGRAWDGEVFGGNQFLALHPDDLEDPTEIAVGRAMLNLPDGGSFESAVGEGLSGPSGSTTIMVSLGPTRCRVETRYGETLSSTTAGTVTIEPIHGEPDWEAHRLDGSTGTGIGYAEHRIDCGTLERSIELARYFRPNERWYTD